MPRQPKPALSKNNISGLKHFRQLQPLLARLHEVGTQSDTAGNRQLFFDHYASLILLYFFNPGITSLRGIQQASGLDKVQKKLGVPHASLGSLSAAARVFDPEPLQATTIPKIAGGAGSVTSFNLKIDKKYSYKGKKVSVLNLGCPTPKLPVHIESIFSDGTKLEAELIRTCTAKG